MDGSDVVAAGEDRFRGKESNSNGRLGTRRGLWARAALGALVVVNAVAFLAASVIHFGIPIPLGVATLSDVVLLPAGIAEGAIGVAFAVAAAAMFARWTWAWNGTVAAHLFGIVGVFIGLGVSLSDSGDSSRANFLFHLTILPILVVGLGLVLTRSGRAALGRNAAAPKVTG